MTPPSKTLLRAAFFLAAIGTMKTLPANAEESPEFCTMCVGTSDIPKPNEPALNGSSCRDLFWSALMMSKDDERCLSEYQLIGYTKCDCSVPPTLPAATDCPLCADGSSPTNGDTIFDNSTATTCDEASNYLLSFPQSQASCAKFQSKGRENCGCPDTNANDNQFDPPAVVINPDEGVPDGGDRCSLCLDTDVMPNAYVKDGLTCEDYHYNEGIAIYKGDHNKCLSEFQLVGYAKCGCTARPPVSPAPETCTICADGSPLSNGDTIFDTDTGITCAEAQNYVLEFHLSENSCATLQSKAATNCGCSDGASDLATEAPSSIPTTLIDPEDGVGDLYNKCTICRDSWIIPDPDKLVNGNETCQDLYYEHSMRIADDSVECLTTYELIGYSKCGCYPPTDTPSSMDTRISCSLCIDGSYTTDGGVAMFDSAINSSCDDAHDYLSHFSQTTESCAAFQERGAENCGCPNVDGSTNAPVPRPSSSPSVSRFPSKIPSPVPSAPSSTNPSPAPSSLPSTNPSATPSSFHSQAPSSFHSQAPSSLPSLIVEKASDCEELANGNFPRDVPSSEYADTSEMSYGLNLAIANDFIDALPSLTNQLEGVMSRVVSFDAAGCDDGVSNNRRLLLSLRLRAHVHAKRELSDSDDVKIHFVEFKNMTQTGNGCGPNADSDTSTCYQMAGGFTIHHSSLPHGTRVRERGRMLADEAALENTVLTILTDKMDYIVQSVQGVVGASISTGQSDTDNIENEISDRSEPIVIGLQEEQAEKGPPIAIGAGAGAAIVVALLALIALKRKKDKKASRGGTEAVGFLPGASNRSDSSLVEVFPLSSAGLTQLQQDMNSEDSDSEYSTQRLRKDEVIVGDDEIELQATPSLVRRNDYEQATEEEAPFDEEDYSYQGSINKRKLWSNKVSDTSVV